MGQDQSKKSDANKTPKCVVIGDAGVGKTSFIHAFTNTPFSEEYIPTINDTFNVHFNVGNKDVVVEVHDTAGGKDYEKLRTMSYSQAETFIIVFSLINASSFENVRKKWVAEIGQHNTKSTIIIVGTKLDLRNDKTTLDKLKAKALSPITTEQGILLAKEVNAAKYIEFSAQNRTGANDVFYIASKLLGK